MRIYFACSITGGREFEGVYQELIAALLFDGHEIPTAHLADSGVTKLEAQVLPGDVYARDVAWIEAADALIAEVSVPSHGVGYEVGYALNLGKPVLCLAQDGRKVSKMITGNPHPRLEFRTYHDPEEAIRSARDFMARLSQAAN